MDADPPVTLEVYSEQQDCYSANDNVTGPKAEILAQNCNLKW